MSQRGKRPDKRKRFKICRPHSSSLESFRSKDYSTSEIKSVSYSSEDQKIRYKNVHNSEKSHSIESLKSHLDVRKVTNSNDSGFRRNSDFSNKHKRGHHHHKDHFLTTKSYRTENPKCHKIVHPVINKQSSESCGRAKYRISENERYRRFSSIEVDGLIDRNSLCRDFHSVINKKEYSNRSSECNHINDERNRIKEQEKDNDAVPEFVYYAEDRSISNFHPDEKGEKVEESIEGSARTRGSYFKRDKGRKSCKKLNQNLNLDYYDFCKSTRVTESQPERRSKSESRANYKNNSRERKFVENSSKKSLNSKVNKTEGTKKTIIEGSKIADAEEDIFDSISNTNTFETMKNQGPDRNSSQGRKNKLKMKERKNKSNSNLNSEKGKVKNATNDSESKIREFQEMNRRKNQKKRGTRCKNSRPEFKRKTLHYLIYLIRKSILSDRGETRNKVRDKKMKISNENSSIRIYQENKIESGCESSGYDSLKNIQDRLSEINKNGRSGTIFSYHLESTYLKNCFNEIEFLDTEKYCIYKIYKSTDGGIILRESQGQELKKGEYVIGKRILKKPGTILNFSKNTTSEINSNQLFSQRNNSTQTEIDLASRKSSGKQSWFRKSIPKKCHSRSKKYFASLASASVLESSDLEPFNLPSRKTRKSHSSSSKKSLSNLSKPSAHFLKKSVAVDTSDLINLISVNDPGNEMVVLFNKSENKDSENFGPKQENSSTPLCEETKLIFNIESIKSSKIFSPSLPSMISVPPLKTGNSESFAQKINMEEISRVQMENKCNFMHSTEHEKNKPESLEGTYQDTRPRKEKKSSKHFFRVFKRKKKYNSIIFEDEKLEK